MADLFVATTVIRRLVDDTMRMEFKRDISERGWDDTKMQAVAIMIVAEILPIQFRLERSMPIPNVFFTILHPSLVPI
jgi:hypothetical protein